MANFNISYVYQAIDKFTPVVKKIQGEAESFRKRMEKTQKALDTTSQSLDRFGKSWSMKVTLPLIAAGGASLFAAGKFQKLQASFTTLLGSGEKATQMLTALDKMETIAPFDMEDLAETAKKLLPSYNNSIEKTVNALTMLTDVAAGAGAPINDIAQSFARVKARGVASTRELLVFQQSGIPIFKVLEKQLGVNSQGLMKLAEKGKLTSTVITKAFKNMTSAGGVFYKASEHQMAMLPGAWFKLKDSVGDATRDIGLSLLKLFNIQGGLSKTADAINFISQKITAFADAHPIISRLVVISLALAAALGPVVIILGQIASAISSLITMGPMIAAVFGGISLPMVVMAAAAVSLLNTIRLVYEAWDDILYVADKVIAKAKGFAGGLFGKPAPFPAPSMQVASAGGVAAQEVNANASLNANINLNAPKGVIKNATVQTAGIGNANVGLNMAGT